MDERIDMAGAAPRGVCGAFVEASVDGDMVRGAFALPRNTSAARYLEGLSAPRRIRHEAPEPLTFDDACAGAATDPDPAAATGVPDAASANPELPFLSVVVRTQGKRIAELADVLLCLYAQRDDDFEVLVMGHKVAPGNLDALLGLIRSFPPSLVRRVRYYPVDFGNRTTPLQVGFGVARGRYVAALDDDDLVMDTWVADFHKAALGNEGKMLHSDVVTQDWGILASTRDAAVHALQAQGTFGDQYCNDFNIAAQFSENACPLMGLAFPRFVYEDLGLSFDERLNTCEDWDFLMRVYSVCGVADTGRVSSVYRIWTNAETSHTVHNRQDWDRDYTAITDKMVSRPYLLDTEAVDAVRGTCPYAPMTRETLVASSLLLALEKPADRNAVSRGVFKVRADELPTLRADRIPAQSGGATSTVAFPFPAGGKAYGQLVFSPLSAGFKVFGEFTLRLVEEGGAETVLDLANCTFHNGYQVDCNHIVFLKENPFVAFRFARPMRLERAEFTFKLLASVSDSYIDQVTLGEKGLIIGRGRRWLYRKMHGDA